MATIFLEGFDNYGPVGQNAPTFSNLLLQEWPAIAATPGQVAGLSSTGSAIQIGFAFMFKPLPSSYTRLIGGFRFQANSVGSSFHVPITFLDGAAQQCFIGINLTGTIGLGTGGSVASLFATSTAAVANNATHYLEFDLTFSPTGNYQLWLDGLSILSGTGNLRGGTGNSWVNVFGMGRNSANNSLNGTVTVDDLYLFDTTGSVNNAVLNTNPRIETQYPTSDAQTQWTNAGNTIIPVGLAQTSASNVTANTNAAGANQLVLMKITPAVNCNLQSVYILPAATAAAAKNKAVLYTDSAGSPNTLVATGTEVVGTTNGTALSLPFASGQALTSGTSYWIGYITDTSVALSQYDATTAKGQRAANTYTSGAPASAPAMTTGQASWEIWGYATGASTNWESVVTNPASGIGPSADTSTITSSTVNNEDLYGFPALTTAATTVHSVAVKANAKQTGTGARTITLRVKSNLTDSAGTNTGAAPGNSYGWISSYFDQDPNGPANWTGSAVNAATSGPKVTT